MKCELKLDTDEIPNKMKCRREIVVSYMRWTRIVCCLKSNFQRNTMAFLNLWFVILFSLNLSTVANWNHYHNNKHSVSNWIFNGFFYLHVSGLPFIAYFALIYYDIVEPRQEKYVTKSYIVISDSWIRDCFH